MRLWRWQGHVKYTINKMKRFVNIMNITINFTYLVTGYNLNSTSASTKASLEYGLRDLLAENLYIPRPVKIGTPQDSPGHQ